MSVHQCKTDLHCLFHFRGFQIFFSDNIICTQVFEMALQLLHIWSETIIITYFTAVIILA